MVLPSPFERRLPRALLLHSVWTGLCPLIPIPFLDDWVLHQLRERLVTELAQLHGREISAIDRRALARAPEGAPRGCAGGCAFLGLRMAGSLAVRLVRKVFRKIVFVLALKDCVDAASSTFHLGWLIHHIFSDDELAELPVDLTSTAAHAACHVVDPRPVERALRHVFSERRASLTRAARQLSRDLRHEGRPLERDEEAIDPLVDRLETDLRECDATLERLERFFQTFLETGKENSNVTGA